LKSWCLGMLRECLVYSSMRLEAPFIALRQLGVVESIPGRQFLPYVACTTGHCPVWISFLLRRSRPLKIQSRWRTGHCPVHTGQSGAPFWPLARPRVTRGLLGRPLAHQKVWWFIAVHRWSLSESDDFACEWLTGQSGAPPDSPVIYSRSPLIASREQPVDSRQPGAPDTVRCTTG
jgi:hypothetical protein